MSEKVAKVLRRESRKRFEADLDALVAAIRELPLWFRLRFCLGLLFKTPWERKKRKTQSFTYTDKALN